MTVYSFQERASKPCFKKDIQGRVVKIPQSLKVRGGLSDLPNILNKNLHKNNTRSIFLYLSAHWHDPNFPPLRTPNALRIQQTELLSVGLQSLYDRPQFVSAAGLGHPDWQQRWPRLVAAKG